ncbi:hypothetical protein [Candidatus Viadribacter manganicus]|uniref:Cell envelope biogenesis protein TolA n=1 Tax=Candidatus Viadribacter manganicus TaxID=1759059 RepID=A0A1B1AK40_9PROT|nr:hypothetical protein [Candidatus Viadribacter manganicus]ANP46927.1 hypothetical protein ATE48_13870 [Candidatus Viadribacter manganicus]
MRAGWVVSAIGHVGFVVLTMLAWETRSTILPSSGTVVPVEIVDVAAESNVRALARDVPDEEVSGSEAPPSEEQEAPSLTPEPAPRRPRQPQEEFNVGATQDLLNRDAEQRRRREHGETSDRDQIGGGLGTAERVALEDRVSALTQRAMLRCWRMPADLPDPERLVVTLSFELDRNGNLRGQPRVVSPTNTTFDPHMRAAVEAALRAVRSCNFSFFPEDPAVGPHYDAWDELDYTFRVQAP